MMMFYINLELDVRLMTLMSNEADTIILNDKVKACLVCKRRLIGENGHRSTVNLVIFFVPDQQVIGRKSICELDLNRP